MHKIFYSIYIILIIYIFSLQKDNTYISHPIAKKKILANANFIKSCMTDFLAIKNFGYSSRSRISSWYIESLLIRNFVYRIILSGN